MTRRVLRVADTYLRYQQYRSEQRRRDSLQRSSKSSTLPPVGIPTMMLGLSMTSSTLATYLMTTGRVSRTYFTASRHSPDLLKPICRSPSLSETTSGGEESSPVEVYETPGIRSTEIRASGAPRWAVTDSQPVPVVRNVSSPRGS